VQLQLLGWGPDLDPATSGVLVDMDGVIPTQDGFMALESTTGLAAENATQVARSLGAVNTSTGLHAVMAVYQSSSTASTCTLLEIGTAGALTARGTYTAGTYTTPVMFRQFDSSLFAAREGSALKRATKGASFTDATGAPSCALIETTRDFLIAFNTSTGYDWHCCAVGNAGDWTPSVSTQSARGIFYDKGGPVVAAGRFGEYVVAFTQTQTWLGRYVGAPEVWQWEQYSRDVGCAGPEAICETPYGLVWSSNSDIHIYDGQGIRSLDTDPCRRSMFVSSVEPTHIKAKRQLAFDKRNNLLWVMWAYAINGNASVYEGRTRAFVYHFETKKWAPLVTFPSKAANQLPLTEYVGLSQVAPTESYDTFMFVKENASLYHIRPTNGATGQSGHVETGVFGDPVVKTMCRAVRVRYATKGTDSPAACLTTIRQAMDGTSTATSTATLDADLKYPFRQTGRYHSVKMYVAETDVVNGLDVDLVPMGGR
jgi:hypothetical protein